MFMKGAFIQFMETILVPLPNVIVFQFNPETITHSWSTMGRVSAAPATTTTAPATTGGDARTPGNPYAIGGLPSESFSFTIQLDANDQIMEGGPVGAAIAELTGVYSRLAALEMLMFPGSSEGSGLVSGSSSTQASPRQVPTVLFIWGPGRIQPVRITSMTVTEKLFDKLLNPTYAEVQLQMTALTSEDLANATGPLAELAKFAAQYMLVSRQALAVANLANAAESIVGMLPV